MRIYKLPNITAPICQIDRASNDSKFNTRPDFERDRDRILYSRPFRRLAGKTQVFLTASHDYVRTRLTHTLEVAQLARDITAQLGLDTSLAEAIALGHDLGHAPFGHVGERALNEIMNGCMKIAPCQEALAPADKGFKHNLQSCRMAQSLSRLYSGEDGLNLTNFTLWGMANHSSPEWKPCDHFEEKGSNCRLEPFAGHCICKGHTSVDYYGEMIRKYTTLKDSELPAWSFEAFIVSLADEIAQRHHDLEDALVTRITNPQEVVEILNEYFRPLLKGQRYREDRFYLREIGLFVRNEHRPNQESAFIPYVSRFILNLLKKRLIINSNQQLHNFYDRHGIRNDQYAQEDYNRVHSDLSSDKEKPYSSIIDYDPDCKIIDKKLHNFLKERVLNSFHAQRMDGVGTHMIRHLAEAYMTNPQQLPDKMIGALIIDIRKEPLNPRDPKTFGEYREDVKEWHNKSGEDGQDFQIRLLRSICDHIACMTDRYALVEYQQLYGSASLRMFDSM